MKKKILSLLTSTLIILLFCSQKNKIFANPIINTSKKISIITTLFPLYDFAKNVGKEKVEVILLLPPGVEAHSFEPKPSDILKINQADLFIYTGEHMEPWVKNITAIVDTKKVKIVNTSLNVKLLHNLDFEEKKNNHIPHKKCSHASKESFDPHIWLDFDNAKIMIVAIQTALIQHDPSNAPYYKKNAEKYILELTQLDTLYKNKIKNCCLKKIIYGGHYAFGYLTKKYNLEYIASQGFSPDSEPSIADLILIIEEIKNKKIKHIFYEEISNKKIAETIAVETGVKLLLLNAMHNVSREDLINNISYISIMEKNLENICIGLNYTA